MCADDRNPLFATGTPRPPAGAPSRGGPRSSAHSRSGFQLDPKEGSGVDAHQTEIQVRRGRDSNPRGFRLPLFESGTINHSDTSPHRSLNFRVPLKRFNYLVKWPFFAFVCSSRSCTPRLNRQSPTDTKSRRPRSTGGNDLYGLDLFLARGGRRSRRSKRPPRLVRRRQSHAPSSRSTYPSARRRPASRGGQKRAARPGRSRVSPTRLFA